MRNEHILFFITTARIIIHHIMKEASREVLSVNSYKQKQMQSVHDR